MGLMSALFVLVVMAVFGAMMVEMAGVQRRTSLLALQGTRALHAATAGLEWGMHEALAASACPASTTINLSEGGLRGFRVSVSCSSSAHREAGDTFDIYSLTVVAEYANFGDLDYTRRRLVATLTDAP